MSSGEIGLALDKAYGVGLNGKEHENNENLEIVKKINKGHLSADTKLNIQVVTPSTKTK